MCNGFFPRQMEGLKSIPGVSERSAAAIPAEAGSDLSSFQDAARQVSWAGLRPGNDQSAGRVESRATAHGNKCQRATLMECAWAASRTQGSFFNKFSHAQAVVRRKPRMKVQVAIARKALAAAWFVLHDGVPYRYPSKDDSVPAPTQGRHDMYRMLHGQCLCGGQGPVFANRPALHAA